MTDWLHGFVWYSTSWALEDFDELKFRDLKRIDSHDTLIKEHEDSGLNVKGL